MGFAKRGEFASERGRCGVIGCTPTHSGKFDRNKVGGSRKAVPGARKGGKTPGRGKGSARGPSRRRSLA